MCKKFSALNIDENGSEQVWVSARTYQFRAVNEEGSGAPSCATSLPPEVMNNLGWQHGDQLRPILNKEDRSVRLINLTLEKRLS